jgi:hypothetical protein
MTPFPFGKILPPEKAYYGKFGRGLLCVTEECLEKIAERSAKIRRLRWDDYVGRCWCAIRRTRRGEVVLKAILWDWGGWRVRLFDERKGEPHDLCFAFTPRAALFPSPQSAMKAAEVFSSGQYWEVERLVWMDQEDNWHFRGVRTNRHHVDAG